MAVEAVDDALVAGDFGVPASGLGVVAEGGDVGMLGVEGRDELGCGLVVVALLADVGVGAGAGDVGAGAVAVATRVLSISERSQLTRSGVAVVASVGVIGRSRPTRTLAMAVS